MFLKSNFKGDNKRHFYRVRTVNTKISIWFKLNKTITEYACVVRDTIYKLSFPHLSLVYLSLGSILNYNELTNERQNLASQSWPISTHLDI